MTIRMGMIMAWDVLEAVATRFIAIPMLSHRTASKRRLVPSIQALLRTTKSLW